MYQKHIFKGISDGLSFIEIFSALDNETVNTMTSVLKMGLNEPIRLY